MSSSSWWAKKLSTEPAPARTSTPPVAPPPRPRLAPVPPVTPQSAPDMRVTSENIADAAMLWQGGEATRTEQQNCPNCGSHLYFSRANSGTAAASRCYACGFTPGRPMQGIPS